MTTTKKRLSGHLYNAFDDEIRAMLATARQLTYEYNNLPPRAVVRRQAILQELFGYCGADVIINPIFQCDFGFNIYIEGSAMINYNCTMLDTAKITIGSHVFIGPGTCLACPQHPLQASERNAGWEHELPITIAEDVWLGANCTILGGVTIGARSVIGAGSIVTHSIPAGVVAAGNPCRVLRQITAADKWFA